MINATNHTFFLKPALVVSVLLAIVACRAPETSAGDIDRPLHTGTEAAETASETPKPNTSDADTSSNATDAQGVTMEKSCGDVTFRILRDSQGGTNRTSLSRVGADGGSTTIDKPEEMTDYTAVGLGCAAAGDGSSYFVVQYGELPSGCKFCEWFYLYDLQGEQLTRSTPPILIDESLPEGERQSSNTREYQALLEKLDIAHPEVEYIR
jgi:hypothetical protein